MGDEGPGGRGWQDADWGSMHDGMGWGGWLLVVLMLLLLTLVAVGIVLLLTTRLGGARTAPGNPIPPQGQRDPAEQVLDERYARGEIDEEEYLRRRSVLRGG